MARRRKRIPGRHHDERVDLARVVARWTARGLTRAVLENIRSGAFDIPRPTTPWRAHREETGGERNPAPAVV
jgi:hypothetical protein